MAAAVWELAKQSLDVGGSETPRAVGVYLVQNAPNFAEAYAAVVAAAGGTLAGLPSHSVNLDEQGGGVWTATVNYTVGSGRTGYELGTPGERPNPLVPAPTPPQEPTAAAVIGPEWSFDTTGGTQHITQSLATRDGVGTTGPLSINNGSGRFKRAIGVTKDSVEGVDVVARKLEIGLTVRPSFVTLGYIQDVFKLTATTNKDPYLGFAAGELLFLGASGQSQTPTDGSTPAWTVSFKWAASPNRTQAMIDPVTMQQVTKVAGNLYHFALIRGWDYVWVTYAQKSEDGRTSLVPETAWVEKVYADGDFRKLGLFS